MGFEAKGSHARKLGEHSTEGHVGEGEEGVCDEVACAIEPVRTVHDHDGPLRA